MINLYKIKDSTNTEFVAIKNDLISITMETHGSWEGHLVNLYYSILKQNSIVIDIGSNIGYHSIHFGKIVGKNGRVFAFEPNKIVFDILSSNILINGMSNIIYQNNFGISSKEGKMFLSNVEDVSYKDGIVNYGGHRLLDDNNGGHVVEVRNLDSIFNGHVDFIKIDIEGMEYDVIVGATETIKKSLPIIFIEISKNHENLYSKLKEMGYVIYKITNHGNGNDYVCLHHTNHKNIINNIHSLCDSNDIEYKIL